MRKKSMWITGAAAAAVALGGASAAVAGNNRSGDDQPLTGTTLQQASEAALARTGQGTVTSAETGDSPNSAYEVDVRLGNGEKHEVNLNGSFQVVQSGLDRDDGALAGPPLGDADRAKASEAALAAVGQGRVGEIERENEGLSVYEVEVIRGDGFEVDVELGADFKVLHVGAPERD